MSHRSEITPQPRGRRFLRVGREVGLTLGALAGVLCMVMAVLAIAFDVRPVVFRSGSMAPAIDTGALAISRTVDAADMEVGDVVTVRTSKGVRVTHRIQSITRDGGQATLILRGDANTVPDEEPYVVRSADRVLFDVPKAGHVVNAVTSQAGVFAAGLLVGLLMVTAFARRPRDDDENDVGPTTDLVPLWDELADPIPAPPAKRRKGRRDRRRLIASVTMLAVGATIAAVTGSTSASWMDSATVMSGTFTMKVAPPPVQITGCVTSGNNLTITWDAPVSPTTWEFRYVYTDGETEVDSFPGTLRSRTSTTNLNQKDGTVTLVGLFPGGEEASFTYMFAGNGSNRTCELQS